jgi:hypothetical protein
MKTESSRDVYPHRPFDGGFLRFISKQTPDPTSIDTDDSVLFFLCVCFLNGARRGKREVSAGRSDDDDDDDDGRRRETTTTGDASDASSVVAG